MNSVARRIFKFVVPFSLLVLFSVVLFGSYSLSFSSPEWLQLLAREIQAACRDPGTQWMVVICFVSYFVVFLFLEGRQRIAIPHSGPQDALNSSPAPNPIGSGWRRAGRGGAGGLFARLVLFCGKYSDVWLIAFVTLVLLRYAYDYPNAARSLQVVVLLTGIVIGKGIALWAAGPPGRGTTVERREPKQEEPAGAQPLGGGAIVRASRLVSSLAPPEASGAPGVTRLSRIVGLGPVPYLPAGWHNPSR